MWLSSPASCLLATKYCYLEVNAWLFPYRFSIRPYMTVFALLCRANMTSIAESKSYTEKAMH